MSSDTNILPGRLAGFMKFIVEAKSFLKQHKASKDHPDVQRIRGELEERYRDERGRAAVYQIHESALYEDAPVILTLRQFFERYTPDQLRQYHKLTNTELCGLKGDHHPTAILGRSWIGTGALLLSAITIWLGLIKLVAIDNSDSLSAEFLRDLVSPSMVNRLVGVICVVGLFVVIWYSLRMVRNRKQVAFLSSLSRALDLYLDDIDLISANRP